MGSIYETLGGEQPFFDLVDRFYEGVAADELLRPMYPADLTGPKRRLALFLIQLFGGPATYRQERGHPALRLRHDPFQVDAAARDHWLQHMTAAVEATVQDDAVKQELAAYFTRAANALINWPRSGREIYLRAHAPEDDAPR